MKELSIEEKARRYDEAIKEAFIAHKDEDKHLKAALERIFPELRESEDEGMLNQLHSWMKEFGGAEEYTEKVYLWLKELIEKQGEHDKFRDSIQVGDKVTRNKDGVLVNLSQLKRVAKKDEKQGEQKPVSITDEWIENYWQHEKVNNPYSYDKGEEIQFDHQGFVRFCKKYCKGEQKSAEWHSEDEQNLNTCLGFIPDEFLRRWLKDAVHVKYDKTAWSEEDERIYKVVLELIDSYSKGTIGSCIIPPNAERYAKWFKALKDRLQPKQEWSEQDERTYKSIIYSFTHNYPLTVHQQEFIKSLKHRYTWRPSDEQMEMLENIRKILHADEDIYSESNNLMYNFEELIRQLKKLKA